MFRENRIYIRISRPLLCGNAIVAAIPVGSVRAVAALFAMLFVLLQLSCLAHADALDLLRAGLAARGRGDLDGAISFYSEAIAFGGLSETSLALVLESRGVTFEMTGEFDKATDDLDEAIRLKPEYGSAYIHRGLVLVKKNDPRRAIIDFTTAITLDQRHAHLALNDRANTYDLMGEYDRAIEDYGRAIQLKPNDAALYRNRAKVLYKIADYDGAIADDTRAIGLNPDFGEAYANRGVAYLAEGKTELAIEDFGAAIKLNPFDATAYGNRGAAYAAAGEFDRSVADFSTAIRLQPNLTVFHIKRAQAELYAAQPDAATTDLLAALKLDPADSYAMVWLYLANARTKANDFPELRSAARNVDPNKWPGAIINLYLGSSARETISVATYANEAAGATSERRCQISFYLGMFDLIEGNKTEAESYFQKSVDSCPQSLFELAAAKVESMRLTAQR
jgi:tetratricopeptide (TPR) repeat protein